MTEFAYSGLGLNAHYDTPRSPWERSTGRIPGGSSSGTAVAVADGMAVVGLGTDTGGSCRIPAAFCGIVGYKPTARRVPLDGVTPLSFSLDSVGPLGRTVDCCAIVDDVLAGGSGMIEPEATPPERLRLGSLRDLMLDDADPEVLEAYEDAIGRLAGAGVQIVEVPFPELHEVRICIARAGWRRPRPTRGTGSCWTPGATNTTSGYASASSPAGRPAPSTTSRSCRVDGG